MVDHDCVIVGAGFAGLRSMIEMKRRGLSVQLVEAGSGVGGAWYWNRYPGARTDTESWAYCFGFDDDLLQHWDWHDRYPNASQVRAYLEHVVDRFGLGEDIRFNTRLIGAERDSAGNRWIVSTSDGRKLSCTYFISALGPLSTVIDPPFPGLKSFRGEYYKTARWPKHEVDFAGKRVAVIGTGATGVQIIPLVAQTAEHLTVFQRTANYVLPARNWPIDPLQMKGIKASYSEMWPTLRTGSGFPYQASGRIGTNFDDDAFHAILEYGWEVGGFNFLIETFDDVMVDLDTNERVADFIRGKIRTVVKDPMTAEMLCPSNHPFGGKRPPVGHCYFEAYNRRNVSLVDVGANAIADVTEAGLRLADGSEYAFDLLIFATGFDAVTGSYNGIDIRGEGGATLADLWKDGTRPAFGISAHGFPNMFMLSGAGSVAGNAPPGIEAQVEFVGRAIEHMRASGTDIVEASDGAMSEWTTKIGQIFAMMVQSKTDGVHNWFDGGNVEGKLRSPLFYFGSLGMYGEELRNSAAAGFPGFAFSKAGRHADAEA